MSQEDKLRERVSATYRRVVMDFEAELRILIASPPANQRAWERQRQAIYDAIERFPAELRHEFDETLRDWLFEE